jgi:hypothetical protein
VSRFLLKVGSLMGCQYAAAQHGNRGTAHELLTEADDAGRRLGVDGNLRWTAFGPANARLHRVNIAVTLGDAGTAIDVARSINLSKITVTERKASLLIDTAGAFLQWGKHEKAYLALRAAEQTAPEEVAGRPSVHRLVRELVTTSPPTALASRRPFRRSVEALGAEGVSILIGPGGIEPHPPHTGEALIDSYPWHLALAEADRLVKARTAQH